MNEDSCLQKSARACRRYVDGWSKAVAHDVEEGDERPAKREDEQQTQPYHVIG